MDQIAQARAAKAFNEGVGIVTDQTDAFMRPTTALRMVLVVMSEYPRWWMAAHEVQTALHRRYGERYSESTITARIRDLRKAQYGGHRIDCRKRKGSRAWEYLLRS